MQPTMRWYQTLAWTFFVRQAAAILGLLAIILWVAYSEAERGARTSASASLTAGGYVLDRAFEQQGRAMDAGLEVFTQYSGNVALIEHALESEATTSLAEALAENLPRLSAETALVVRQDGTLLASTTGGGRATLPQVGILQMALAPELAKEAGQPGPFYRGFFREDWGDRPGVYHAVARPLRSPAGKPLGAMLVGVRVDDRLASDLRRLAVAGPLRGDAAAQLAVLSQFGTLGTTFSEAEALNRLLAREPNLLAVRGQVLDGQRSSVLPLQVGGRAYLGMISPLRGVNALDLEMATVLMMPVEPLRAPFRNLQKAILIVGVVGLLVALGLSLYLARKVTAPLKALATAAEGLAKGELPETLAILPTQDEVGVLTRTFKSMVAELKAKDEWLALLEGARKNQGGIGHPPAVGLDLLPGMVSLHPGVAALEAGVEFPEVLRDGCVFAGRYRVDGLLGRGGMGVVLRVHDLHLDEEVALKVVRSGLAKDPAFLDLMKQEIRLARKITHRYVLRTHDFGESDGLPFVTMEYLNGITLRSLLDGRGRLPPPLVLRIARQVAEGLEAAHAVGVVHRDIKPANVLFDGRGDVKIMDFGLAAPTAGLAAGEAGAIVGSPRYMSPEQIRGNRVDARTDLYALGVMLFELCSGLPPFDSGSIGSLLTLHLSTPAPALSEVMPGITPELDALLKRLMAKAPEDRPQTAAEVAEILKLLASRGGNSTLS